MSLPFEFFSPDRSERVDPIETVDELIAYAEWVKHYALGETGRRIPSDAAQLLEASNRDIDEVYKAFSRFRPRRLWVAETRRKMVHELFLNENEIQDYEEQLDL